MAMCFPQALSLDPCIWYICNTTLLYIQALLEPSLWKALLSSLPGRGDEGKEDPWREQGDGWAGTELPPLPSVLLQMWYGK